MRPLAPDQASALLSVIRHQRSLQENLFDFHDRYGTPQAEGFRGGRDALTELEHFLKAEGFFDNIIRSKERDERVFRRVNHGA